MNKKITINGQEYDLENLPPEISEKLQKNLGKLKNIPFAKKILESYGLNTDTLKMNHSSSQPDLDDTTKIENTSFSVNTNDDFSNKPFLNMNSSSPFMQSSSPLVQKKFSWAGLSVGLAIFLFVAGIVGFIFGINSLTSAWEETFELSGDPTHFNPISAVNEIRSHIDPNAKLSSISIDYVRSDGTLDLKAENYHPHAEYNFYRELAEPPKDAPPVGAGGTINGKWYEPVEADVYEIGQWRHVTKIGGGVSTEYSYSNKGIDLDRSSPTSSPSKFIEDPKCQIKEFWQTAIKKGAPENAVARVEYDSDGYTFRISDADIDLEFDTNCKLKED